MDNRKDIDRLFQEKFKDFEQTPSPDMWNRIEAELKKDQQKKRFIPIWWKLGGAAALLILFLTIGGNWKKLWDFKELDIPLVKRNSIESENNPSSSDVLIQSQDKEQLVKSSVSENTKTSDTKRTPLKSEQQYNIIKSANTEIANNSSYNSTPKASKKNMSYQAYASVTPNMPKQEISVINSNLNCSKPQLLTVEKHLTNLYQPIYRMADLFKNKELSQSQTIEEAIAEAEALEMNKIKGANDGPRWGINPMLAPVYSSIGEGSVIGQQFNENSQANDFTMSYGIGASYAISSKLKVRAGINRVDFSNRTNEIMALPSENSLAPSNTTTQNNVTILEGTSVMIMSSKALDRASLPEIMNTAPQGQLIMDYGFIELPVALEYRVLDQKFGVNVIGGFSTFFLNNNQLSTAFNGENVVIGESSNLNNTSYSANFGIGFDYGITKQLNVMLEPMLKYQFNTFNRTFGNVQPMFIGVYTGLNFKF